MNLEQLQMEVHQQIEIDCSIADTFEMLIHRLSDRNVRPDQQPMPMVLEQFPGGRWFRDLGENAGHYWGTVQVIKPPTLLEIVGPLWLSHPVAGHLQIRLTEEESGTKVTLCHRAFGLIDSETHQHASAGWKHYLESLKADCDTA